MDYVIGAACCLGGVGVGVFLTFVGLRYYLIKAFESFW